MHSSDGRARFQNLPAVLLTVHPNARGYREFAYQVRRRAAKAGCDPREMRLQIDFPDFEW